MHYRNGREAHEGDPVIGESYKGSGIIFAGKLHSLIADNTSCNGQLTYPVMGGVANSCVTVGELYHAADAWAAVNAQPVVVNPSTITP